ncbi:uncharacterized protein LOC124675968 isoform X1 [Lolium rigidum]|uniref:uncharacterized protein LOC124675968 isoform X1 n=1 Tax=Lolium rigidum TaxID=89674 RepID=UPI001F5C1513|nr:uncharacterized protein LOC124675968 isoform X1 [Lolium rigidum]
MIREAAEEGEKGSIHSFQRSSLLTWSALWCSSSGNKQQGVCCHRVCQRGSLIFSQLPWTFPRVLHCCKYWRVFKRGTPEGDQDRERISSDITTCKEGGDAERNWSSVWFSTVVELHYKTTSRTQPSAKGNKRKVDMNPKGVGQEQQSEAGTCWLDFCPRPGFTVVSNVVTDNPYGTLKIPKAFCQYIIGDFPQKVMLRNTVGDT